jgi:class 3 adenylate cyclase
VLIYFGYPQAHEDDAERAVKAGLALVEAVGKLRVQELLQVIGVATGLVVVGDLVGSGEAQERGVVGETPNLAARVQAIFASSLRAAARSQYAKARLCGTSAMTSAQPAGMAGRRSG